jgi:hypothetical protein
LISRKSDIPQKKNEKSGGEYLIKIVTKKLHKFNLYVYSKFNFFCFVIFPKELITKKVFEFIFFVTTQKILILIRKSKLYHFILVFRLLFTKWSEIGSSNKKNSNKLRRFESLPFLNPNLVIVLKANILKSKQKILSMQNWK